MSGDASASEQNGDCKASCALGRFAAGGRTSCWHPQVVGWCAVQAFIADCTKHFKAMQMKSSWQDTVYGNGAEAMAGVLEIMRLHEARLSSPPLIPKLRSDSASLTYF